MFNSNLIRDVIHQFAIEGGLVEFSPYGSGHINKTYLSVFNDGSIEKRYIHQWINPVVFLHPDRVMENVFKVTSYTRERIIQKGGDPFRETLNLVPTVNGDHYLLTQDGNYWRTFRFIEGARTYDQATDDKQIYNASKAFGEFQVLLGEYPPENLQETIPDFHNTPKRFQKFVDVWQKDPKNRASGVMEEINLILRHENDVYQVIEKIKDGSIPLRICHNDTKLNNVMIDDVSGKGICVIDLDTVMPGSVLYDFGDSVRIGASTAREDEKDINKVGFDICLFEQLAKGYLDAAREFLSPEEKNLLAFSATLLTLEQAIRFLTDYLQGDQYYKISYPEHNLTRTRTQLKMVNEINRNFDSMERIVQKYAFGK
jgi:Ser/Thr protein kinase RdoA (MazF antagonist)